MLWRFTAHFSCKCAKVRTIFKPGKRCHQIAFSQFQTFFEQKNVTQSLRISIDQEWLLYYTNCLSTTYIPPSNLCMIHRLEGGACAQGCQFPGDFHSSGIRGMAICHSSGIKETKTYSPGFGFGVRGNSGEYFVSDLKSI